MSEPIFWREFTKFVNRKEKEIHFVCVCSELDCIELKYSNGLNRLDSPSIIHKFIEIMYNANIIFFLKFCI